MKIQPGKLVDPDEFDKAFFFLLTKGKEREEAFTELNLKYFECTGMYRYTSYESYRISKHQRLRRKYE